MTGDEARKLMGGYATGSLTEAERKALFEAALEDQDLFDEIAGEQAMKEVLDEPGARQRLVAALNPPRKHRAWLWVTAAATVAIAVVIGVVVSQRTTVPPQQIAQVLKSPEPEVAPAAPPVPQRAVRKVSPPAPSPEPPPELKKEEKDATVAERLQEAKPQADVAARGFVAAAPQAAAAPAPATARFRAENSVVSVPTVFAFNYAVGADGALQITPSAPGFLSVTANDVVLFTGAAVPAGTPIQIQIPPAASNLVIGFSRMPGIAGSPVRRDASAGRETDQDPPNGRILIQLFPTPATR